MFQPDPSIQFVAATREQVVAMVEGINQAQVSLPGKPAQAVNGLLCGVRNGDGTFSIFVVLSVPATCENVVYVSERRRLDVEGYRAAELEGLQFLESMGFMLDDLNYRSLSAEVQAESLARSRAFSPSRSAPASPDPTSRIARLLSSF